MPSIEDARDLVDIGALFGNAELVVEDPDDDAVECAHESVYRLRRDLCPDPARKREDEPGDRSEDEAADEDQKEHAEHLPTMPLGEKCAARHALENAGALCDACRHGDVKHAGDYYARDDEENRAKEGEDTGADRNADHRQETADGDLDRIGDRKYASPKVLNDAVNDGATRNRRTDHIQQRGNRY
jgi:hypothetical protein